MNVLKCPASKSLLMLPITPAPDPDSAIEDHTSVEDVPCPLPFLPRDFLRPVLSRIHHLALPGVVIGPQTLDYYLGDGRPYLDLLVRRRKPIVLSTYYSDWCC
jgi:hypothetical protein